MKKMKSRNSERTYMIMNPTWIIVIFIPTQLSNKIFNISGCKERAPESYKV